jgi:hypothetical protein
MNMLQQGPKAKLYRRYPLANILIYNGSTVLHFVLGGVGIILGYGLWKDLAYLGGILYLVFAFGEMYVLMPLVVCPNCVYYRLEEGVCISGLNVVSRKVARAGIIEDFARRAEGVLSPNNLYVASLLLPVAVIVPALIINFSWGLLGIWMIIIALLIFRFFVIFPKLACIHCQAKYKCPQAGKMGVRDQ